MVEFVVPILRVLAIIILMFLFGVMAFGGKKRE